MKEPYETIINGLEARLNSLGFQLTEDDKYSKKYESFDFSLTFWTEPYGISLSKHLEYKHTATKKFKGLSGGALVHAVDPRLFERVRIEALKKSAEGVAAGLELFVGFLEDNKDIVFTYPVPEPYRQRYIDMLNDMGKQLGIEPDDPDDYDI